MRAGYHLVLKISRLLSYKYKDPSVVFLAPVTSIEPESGLIFLTSLGNDSGLISFSHWCMPYLVGLDAISFVEI